MKNRIFRQNIFLSFLIALLFFTGACAQTSERPATEKILQPYLGKWRPTSASKELYLVSITITETGVSIETGGSVTYELVKKTDEGVIVRVMDRHAVGPYYSDLTKSRATVFGLSLGMHTQDSFPPGGPSKTRELLQICYESGDIDSAVKRLISEMKTGQCPDTYTR